MERQRHGLVLTAIVLGSWATGSLHGQEPSGETRSASESRAVAYDDLLGIADLGVPRESDFEGIGLSPDHDLVAIQTSRAVLEKNLTETRWVIVPLRGDGKIIDGGEGGEPMTSVFRGMINGYVPPQTPQWSSDSQWFAYRARHDGAVQLWRSSRDGSVQEQLTHNAADVESVRWAGDGRRLFFGVGTPRATLESAEREEGKRGFLYDERFAPFTSTTPLVDTDDLIPQIWVYEVDTHIERPATHSERKEYEQLTAQPALRNRPYAKWVRHSSDGRTIVWLDDLRTDAGTGLRPPLTIVASKHSGGRSAIPCDLSSCTGYFKGLWIDEGDRAVFFLRWVGPYNYGAMALYRWKIGGGAVEEILRTDDLLEACTYLRERLLCSHESAMTPKKLVTINLTTGAVQTLYDPNPHLRNLRFGEVTPLTWRDSSGIEGFGHLVKPVDYEKGRRYPLVIVQYQSRGFLRGGVGDEYPIHVFASKGFAVLSFHRPEDWQLEANSKTFAELEERGWVDYRDRRRVLSVLEAGVERLDEMGIIDPKQVGITGLSDGGETASFALIHAPDRFAAAAVSWTWWNPMVYYLAGPKFQPQLQSYGLGYPEQEAAATQWQGISIGPNARKVRTPLLIQVSDAELLPETHTFTALREFGKPVEMHVFPNEFHIKSQPAHRYHIYQRNVQWFQFWLQGVEESDPVDPGQYARWHTLREQRDATLKPSGSSTIH